jgi:hypothetical protein
VEFIQEIQLLLDLKIEFAISAWNGLRMGNKMANRKKRFVLWLHNQTDHRDDEWVVFWALDYKSAMKMDVEYDTHRFSRGQIYSAKEFRDMMGMSP